MALIPAIFVTATVLIFVWIGYRASAAKANVPTFLMYGYRLRTPGLSTIIANSSISLGAAILAFLALGYQFAWVAILATITWLTGFYFHYLLMKRVFSELGNESHRLFTIHGWLRTQFHSPTLRIVASVATVIGFCGAFGVEILAVTKLLEPYYGSKLVHFAVVVVLSACLALGISKGGFASVVRVGYIQFFAFFLAMGLCVWFVFKSSPGSVLSVIWNQFDLEKAIWPVGLVLGLLAINLPWQIVDLGQWQRSLSADSIITVKKSLIYSAVGIALAWITLIILGAAMHAVPMSSNDPVQTFLLKFATHPVWYGILLVAGIAALFSTAEIYVIAAVQALICDIFHPELLDAEKTEALSDSQTILNRARLTIWVICMLFPIIAFGAHLFIEGILELFFVVFSAQLALVPSVVVAVAIPDWKNKFGALLSVVLGIATSFILFICAVLGVFADEIFLFPLITLLVAISVYGVVAILTAIWRKGAI